MEDHKLRVFCTVAETKSFSKTSEIIHLTQPAVSLQIQALEELYETKLFDRSSGTISLTTAGETLYKYSKDILSLYALAAKEIAKLTNLVKGSIKIGAGITFGNHILPSIIVDFKKNNPKIEIDAFIGNTRRILDLLHAGIIDVGIVGEQTVKSKVIVEHLLVDEFCIVVPPNHAWAKKKLIPIAEILKEPIILREEGSSTRIVIEKYLADNGINIDDLQVTLVLGSTSAVKEAVEREMGIAIMSVWSVRKDIQRGHLKMVMPKEGKILRDFSVVTPKNSILPHAMDEFISYLKYYPYQEMLKDIKELKH